MYGIPNTLSLNKRKIINDPIYGFIRIPDGIIFRIIEHPYFQRLRRINQLGLTDFVYPGATHTRFHHAIGSMHLMDMALTSLRNKGVDISDDEFESALITILLHDIGHGPFSHALEFSLIKGIEHEKISALIMQLFNREMDNKLDLSIKIFNGTYHKKFLSQLVASQLDVDRLDYLNRDSFFTGVSEGKVGFERILKMLNVHDNQIVVEEKAIYSIENFLSSRRLMYWQVYLHKTTVAAESLLINLIKRAKFLAGKGKLDTRNKALQLFLLNEYSLEDFRENEEVIMAFLSLDDNDLWGAIKIWMNHEDLVLSELCRMLVERNLFKIFIYNKPAPKNKIDSLRKDFIEKFPISRTDASYFTNDGKLSNSAYELGNSKINVLMKNGDIMDIATASDLPNIKALSKIVNKYYLCFPKSVSL
jgi:HD superfamily phosphohydrolase